ncbi:MAG: trimethylamine methyltransferase family protein [Fimbriimonadaceae bacterium]|nr:trimethylamine methyltransferase family protein [Alphaproteobacteria bacterium]
MARGRGGSAGGRAGGGREARRAQRSAIGSEIIAGISRQIPTYEILTEEGLTKAEDAADVILQEIGVEFRGDEEILDIWRNAGADVQGERVRFEKGMLRAIIQKSAPKQFTQYGRNRARNVEIGANNLVFAPAYGSPFVRDLDNGRRYANIEDFRNFVKLAYQSPWIHHSGGTVCEPVDIPVNKRHLDMVYAHLRYSDKPLMGSVTAGERAADSVEMVRLAFGKDFVDEHCCLLSLINVNSPLVYDGTMLAALKTYARANQGLIITPFILGGAMGPVTVGASVAQVLAEAMAGLALAQIIRPGTPTVLGAFVSSLSLRSGAPTFGMPEPAMAYFAIGQLARRLGVPLRAGGCLTSSKTPDAQAAYESANTLMPTILAGVNFVLHGAGWLEGGLSMGYEKFILDADQLGMMHVLAKGIALDENGLALDAFREVGPGSHFLGCTHTMANYETAYYNAETSDSNSFEQWSEEGEQDSIRRANTRLKELQAQYEAPDIDPGIDEALQDFIARRKDSMPDAWY